MKQLLFGAAMVLSGLSYGQKNNYTLKGELPYKEGQVAVMYNKGNRSYVTNNADIQNGKFELKGEIDAPYKVHFTVTAKDAAGQPVRDNLELFLDTGTTLVRTADSLIHATVTGTQLCKDAAGYQKPIDSLLAVLTAAYEAKEKNATEAEKATPAYAAALAAIDAEYLAQQKKHNVAFIKAHPASRLNLYIFREESYFFEYKELAPLFAGISPSIRNSTAGKEYAARLQRLKAVAVGQPAPEFSHPDTSGRMVNLSAFRGKYVLLDFWASWCGPCRGESPYLVAAHEKYRDKNFTIIDISLDKKSYRKQWLQAIHQDKLYWTQLSDGSDNNPVVKLYGVKGIPQNFLIGPDGKILAHNLRGTELDEKLASLFQ